MQAERKREAGEQLEDLLDSVVNLHVKQSTDKIVGVVEKETREQCKELKINMGKLVECNNTVVEVLDDVSGRVSDFSSNLSTTIDIIKKTQAKADHSDHISHQVRGKLGSQERKRRKIDTDEISRLRNENGVMKRQNRDKEKMIETMSTRVERLAENVKTMNTKVERLSENVETMNTRVEGLFENVEACAAILRQLADRFL